MQGQVFTDVYFFVIGTLFIAFHRPFGNYVSRLHHRNNSKARWYSVMYFVVGSVFVSGSVYHFLSR